MSGNYSVGAKNAILSYIATQVDRISVHTADPGSTGANEATGGSPAYARKTPSWASPSGGAMADASMTFDLPAGTYTHLGMWKNSGNVYWGKLALPAAFSPSTQDTLVVTSVTLDQNAVASA